MVPPRLYSLLRGSWTFVRRIEFPREPVDNKLVKGTGVWGDGVVGCSAECGGGGTLLYEEQGEMTGERVPSPIPVHTSHEWVFSVDDEGSGASRAEVYFGHPTRRPFYCITLGAGSDGPATFTHQCDLDVYTGTLSIEEGGRRLSMEWEVVGPKKDYVIKTTFVRQG